jgi:hypothetical protein
MQVTTATWRMGEAELTCDFYDLCTEMRHLKLTFQPYLNTMSCWEGDVGCNMSHVQISKITLKFSFNMFITIIPLNDFCHYNCVSMEEELISDIADHYLTISIVVCF